MSYLDQIRVGATDYDIKDSGAARSTDVPTVVQTTGTSTADVMSQKAVTDNLPTDFTGTDGTVAGAHGLVPAPATADAGKYLKADGTWDTIGGGALPTVENHTLTFGGQ